MSGPEMVPFDLERMFLGELPPLFVLEIVFRTSVIFLWLLFLLRLTGKRGLAQLSTLELAIVIGLGSAAGDPMLYPEVPLLHAMVVLALVVGLQRWLSRLVVRSEAVETFVEGKPVELVRGGVMDPAALDRARLSREDLFERLRAQEVRQLGQVQRAYFEQDGNLTLFLHPQGQAPAGLPVVPPWDLEAPPEVAPSQADGAALVCLQCGRAASDPAGRCPCGGAGWTWAVTDPLAAQ